MKHSFIIVFTLIALGCQSSSNLATVKLGETFDLKCGQEVAIQNDRLTLTFKQVTADSRCPEGAACIRAGNATIVIGVDRITLALNTSMEARHAQFSNYSIELVSLSPYPKVGQQIKMEDYIARLVVTRK